MKDGGWKLTEKGWELDPSQTERVRLELLSASEAIDASHAHLPQCWLPACQQRVLSVDKYGLCSKTSEPHREERALMEAESQR